MMDFTSISGLAFVRPVVHRNGKEHRSHRWLHRQVKAACNGRWYIFGTQRFVCPFHVGLHDFHCAAGEKWFCKNVATVLLSGSHDQGRVTIESIDDCREPVPDAGNRMHIHEGGLTCSKGIPETHSYRDAFVESKYVTKIGRH